MWMMMMIALMKMIMMRVYQVMMMMIGFVIPSCPHSPDSFTRYDPTTTSTSSSTSGRQ